MGQLILQNAAGPLIELAILVVTGVVLLDRVKNLTRELNSRVGALELRNIVCDAAPRDE